MEQSQTRRALIKKGARMTRLGCWGKIAVIVSAPTLNPKPILEDCVPSFPKRSSGFRV